MKKNLNLLIIVAVSLALVALAFFLLPKGGSGSGFNNKKYVAKVGKEGIKREDFEKEMAKRKNFYVWAKQDVSLSSLENDVIETMIDFELVRQYAQPKSITVSDKDVNKRFNDLVQGSGEPEEKLLNKISQMYGMNKSDYLEVLRKDILKEKVQENLGIPLGDWLNEQKMTVKILR